MPSVALIAGVSRHLGGQVAAQLAADPSIDRVIGIDTVPPRTSQLPLLGRTEFVRADIRNPLIAKVIGQARVTSVVHAALVSSPRQAGGRVAMQETNVIGTMQLLAACQNSEYVERIVLASTTAVYGSSPADPAMFTEDMPHGDGSLAGFAKDAVEVESYVRGFARRRPDVTTTVLRLARVLGTAGGAAAADPALSRYLTPAVVPTAMGFDPRVQLLHELDAVEVLRMATVSARPGIFNVAGPGVIPLSQLLRRAGRIRLPVPAASLGAVATITGNTGLLDLLTEEPNLLKYGRGVDTTRLRTEFSYAPRFSTADAVAACIEQSGTLPRLGALGLGVGSQLAQARHARRLLTSGSTEHAGS